MYSEPLDIAQMIKTQNEEATLNRDIIGYKSADSLHLGFLSKKSGLFSTVDQICIPMTIPIKFVVQEASIYHEIRNLYKQLDMTRESSSREDLRLQILDKLIEIFDQNLSSIQQISSLNFSGKVIVKQSPTIEFLPKFQENQIIEVDELIDTIPNMWLNLFDQRVIE